MQLQGFLNLVAVVYETDQRITGRLVLNLNSNKEAKCPNLVGILSTQHQAIVE